MGFLTGAIDFVRFPTHSRTTAVIVLFLILAAVPLTVIISQHQQTLRQRAAPNDLICSNIDNIPTCDLNFQTNPCSRGDKCIDRNNIVFDSSGDSVVFECKEE